MTRRAGRTFKTREFAELSGVSVRALHHYDRLGLLTPRRTQAGYRLYTEDDLVALEQIVVLKFIGLPLKTIAALVHGPPGHFARVLAVQSQILSRKRLDLDRAIAAIHDLESVASQSGKPSAQQFKRIIEVIEMSNDPTTRMSEYDALVQAKLKKLKLLSADERADLRREWNQLVSDVRAALAEDPASPLARSLATRWSSLLGSMTGKPLDASALHDAYRGQTWKPEMASFVEEDIWNFMARVLAATAKPA